LTQEDIRNIENGVPTVLATNGGFMDRLLGLKNELLYTNDPNGQSISQRFIYWNTGLKILKKNWLYGVGAGDIHLAFQMQYNRDKSPLTKENRNRTHNQYLSYMITFGILGMLIFLGILHQFFKQVKQQKDILALLFLTIACLSFLVEDTLETQMGVTFFAFFFGLFLSRNSTSAPSQS
jgi:O-antigen ligase